MTFSTRSTRGCYILRKSSVLKPTSYIKHVVLFEDNSILPLPGRLEAYCLFDLVQRTVRAIGVSR